MAKQRPLVSVVIPTFNRSGCVADAIDSVLQQSFSDYEIVVVDDGSTDSTRAVVATYGDRVRYVYQNNRGVSAARNTGIRESQGSWIAFLDSDDEWLANKLESQLRCTQDHPELVAVVCDTDVVIGGVAHRLFDIRKAVDLIDKVTILERPLRSVLDYNYFTSSFLISRHALELSGGFNEEMSLYEDHDLFVRIALLGAWGVVGKALARVLRKTNENLSRQHAVDPMASPQALIAVYTRLSGASTLQTCELREIKRRLSDQYFAVGLRSMTCQFGRPRMHLLQSLSVDPSLIRFAKVAALFILRPNIYSIVVSWFGQKRKRFRRSELE